MRKNVFLVVGILIIGGFAASNVSSFTNTQTTNDFENMYSIDDLSARIHFYAMHPEFNNILKEDQFNQDPLKGRDYPIGTIIWQYYITGGSDNSVKAIAPIEDINGDGKIDVIVCSEDYNVRCFSGGAIGTGSVIWTRYIYSGSLNYQNELSITQDINNDGYDDVVVGTPWGSRSIISISGLDGSILWTHDTHEYGGGGWVYQVDCKYDYNNDGVIDVLAVTGDDSSDTGPKRVYCLNGLNGISIWESPLGGPGFSVIGVEDFTGDGKPDVIAGCSNEAETIGYVKGISGANGAQLWSFTTAGSSVWALEQTDDINGDGVKDVIAGDFSGHIYGLSATNGALQYSTSIGTVIIQRFAKLTDINGNGHPDFVPEHSTSHTTQAIDGQTGAIIWNHDVADQPWRVARIPDISGDNKDDVLVGTMYNNNYCYFLNGVDGSDLVTPIAYGEAVDGLNAIPDVVNDGSWEMVAGGRNGKLTCFSGGLNAGNNPPTKPVINGPSEGIVGIIYEFTFVSTEPDNEDVYYFVDWGDGSNTGWFGPFESGVQATKSHSWLSTGNYYIKAKAKDEKGAESVWSDTFIFSVYENQPPNTPEITGPTSGKPGVELIYTVMTTDPNNDDVYYYIDWGDGSNSGWIGPNASGDNVTVTHKWTKKGTYTINFRAKDIYGLQSGWGTLKVTIPRTYAHNSLILRLLERFPNLFPILRYLMGL